MGNPLGARHADRPGDAEVGDHRMPALDQDVRRLDVAVDHAPVVRIPERVGHLAGDLDRAVDRELLLAVNALSQ